MIRDTDLIEDIEDNVTRSLEFDKWKAFKRLNLND